MKLTGARFEISIEGAPRTHRDRKPLAIEAAEHLKRKHPHSTIVVKDLESVEVDAVKLCHFPQPRRPALHGSGSSYLFPSQNFGASTEQPLKDPSGDVGTIGIRRLASGTGLLTSALAYTENGRVLFGTSVQTT